LCPALAIPKEYEIGEDKCGYFRLEKLNMEKREIKNRGYRVMGFLLPRITDVIFEARLHNRSEDKCHSASFSWIPAGPRPAPFLRLEYQRVSISSQSTIQFPRLLGSSGLH
jgi:hypothetical protein